MPFMPGGSDNTLQVRVESDGTSGFRDSMDGAIDSVMGLKAAVGIASGAVAAFATGALAVAANEAANFEDAMVEVEKVTNETTAATLSGEIKDMAETIPLAQSELAGLTADAARFGITGTDNIRNFTETVAKMATATNISATESGENLAKLSELTDTPISDVENLGSSINALSNNFATSAQEVVDSMLRSSAALSQFGLNQRQIAGIGTSLNEVSASARRAGTRLRRVAQELMDPGKAEKVANAIGMTSEEFRTMREEKPDELLLTLAETMAEGGDKADDLRQTFSTVSRQALAGLGQNIDGTREALEMSNESYEEATSLQEEYDAAVDTFNSKIQLMKNRLRNTAIEIGNEMLPALTGVVETVNEFIGSEESLINQLSAETKMWGLVASAVLGVAGVVATFVSGPLGALIAAVGLLGIAWSTNFLGIRDTTMMVFRKIRDFWDRFVAPLIDDATTFGKRILREWEETWTGILNAVDRTVRRIRPVVNRHMSRIREIWKMHGEELMNEFMATIRPVVRFLRRIFTRMRKITKRGIERASAFWDEWGDEILTVVKFTTDTILTTLRAFLDTFLTAINVGLNVLQGDWDEVWEEMAGLAERQFDRVKRFLDRWDIQGAIGDIASGVGRIVKNRINDAIGLPWSHTIGQVEVQGNEVFSGHTLKIPALAEGGVVTDPTLALLGESGPEAVQPLDSAGGTGGPMIGTVVINANSREGGRQAGAGFRRQIRAMNVADTGAVR